MAVRITIWVVPLVSNRARDNDARVPKSIHENKNFVLENLDKKIEPAMPAKIIAAL